MKFLDANIFLRLLAQPVTDADKSKHAACFVLFEQAEEGAIRLTTSEAIVHETLYVLCSPRHYGLSHQHAVDLVRPALALRAMYLEPKHVYMRAMDLFAEHRFLDFPDAIAIARVESSGDDLISYDRDYDRVPGVKRLEP